MRIPLLLGACALLTLCAAHNDHDLAFEMEDEFNIKQENLLRKNSFVADGNHIRDHLEDFVEFDPDTATDEEKQWHFFRIHDTDEDDRLDGLEILAALRHSADSLLDKIHAKHGEEHLQKSYVTALYDRMIAIVDQILSEDDKDLDGYLDFVEYRSATIIKDTMEQVETAKKAYD